MKTCNDLECILLVDDDSATNYLHKLVIQKAELHVHTQVVTNGIEALNYLLKQSQFSLLGLPLPGIIFLDINMPKMNGWEFLKEYQKLPADSKAKAVVIMLTNSLNPDDLKIASDNSDVSMFINKPLTLEVLSDIVNRYYQSE